MSLHSNDYYYNGVLHLELQKYVLIALQLKEYRNKKSTRTKTYKKLYLYIKMIY